MKAKEMAEIYKKKPTVDTLARLAHDMVMESKTIAEQRHIKSDSALNSILRELDDKWRAFTKLCPEVNPNGFKIALHVLVPLAKEIFP
jgi:UPF0288 family protein (methanogenesis marker protein 3)